MKGKRVYPPYLQYANDPLGYPYQGFLDMVSSTPADNVSKRVARLFFLKMKIGLKTLGLSTCVIFASQD